MKPTINISSVMSDVKFPKKNVEAVANYNKERNEIPNKECVMCGYENTSWRFLNTLGIGHVQINFRSAHPTSFNFCRLPATARFMAVCTKIPTETYTLKYIISLS